MPDLIPEILSVGVSAMLMQVMMLVQMTVVYNTAVRYGGDTQIALMGASQRVMQLAFVPVWGMNQGMQPVRLMFSAFPTYGLLIMIITYFQMPGKAKQAGFMVVLRQLVLIVPLVLLLPALLKGNVLGVWLTLPLNDLIILAVAIILLIQEYRYLGRLQESAHHGISNM